MMKGHKHKKLDRRDSKPKATEHSIRLFLNPNQPATAPQKPVMLTSPPREQTTDNPENTESQPTQNTSNGLRGMKLADFYIGSCYREDEP